MSTCVCAHEVMSFPDGELIVFIWRNVVCQHVYIHSAPTPVTSVLNLRTPSRIWHHFIIKALTYIQYIQYSTCIKTPHQYQVFVVELKLAHVAIIKDFISTASSSSSLLVFICSGIQMGQSTGNPHTADWFICARQMEQLHDCNWKMEIVRPPRWQSDYSRCGPAFISMHHSP